VGRTQFLNGFPSSDVIHRIKPTNALMLKLFCFYTQFCHNSNMFQSVLIIFRVILCTKFNVFNNPSVFLYMYYYCSVTPWRWST